MGGSPCCSREECDEGVANAMHNKLTVTPIPFPLCHMGGGGREDQE